jgi:osmoprotectant transport system ATP-binding protein
MPAAIEFSDVRFEVREAAKRSRAVLDCINLAVEQGSVTALLGRSGSGKTTLLRMVNRLNEPTSGRVRVHGEDVAAAEPIALRRGIGYVIQEAGLFPHLTVARNILMVPELEGKAPRTLLRHRIDPRVRELLAMVGLAADRFASRYPRQLSGGQRQRVGLARALAAEPRVLLMDEPLGALDPLTRAEMQEMLKRLFTRLAGEGRPKTVLIVTHDLDEALFLADRIVLIDDGCIKADLTPHAFLHSETPEAVAYVQASYRGERMQA